MRLSGIPENLKINAVTKEQRRKFAALLKAFPITVADFRPIDEAIVTSGGVCVKEINQNYGVKSLLGTFLRR